MILDVETKTQWRRSRDGFVNLSKITHVMFSRRAAARPPNPVNVIEDACSNLRSKAILFTSVFPVAASLANSEFTDCKEKLQEQLLPLYRELNSHLEKVVSHWYCDEAANDMANMADLVGKLEEFLNNERDFFKEQIEIVKQKKQEKISQVLSRLAREPEDALGLLELQPDDPVYFDFAPSFRRALSPNEDTETSIPEDLYWDLLVYFTLPNLVAALGAFSKSEWVDTLERIRPERETVAKWHPVSISSRQLRLETIRRLAMMLDQARADVKQKSERFFGRSV